MSAAPKCPIHNRTMKQWSDCWKCTQSLGEGMGYCNQRIPLTAAEVATAPAAQPTPTTALTTPAPPPQMPSWLAEPLREYIGNPAFDMLLPSVPVSAALGYGHRVAVSVVQISANPDDREVFKVGTRDGQPVFAYTKQALEKFAEAAGVQVKTTRVDDRRDPGYCEFQALGGMLSSRPSTHTRSIVELRRSHGLRSTMKDFTTSSGGMSVRP